MKEDDLVKKNSFCPSFLTGNLSCLLLRRFNYLHFIIKGKREVLAAGHLSLTFVKATWKKNLFSMRTRIIPARTFTESGSPRDLAIWFGIKRKTKQKSTRTYFFLVSSASGQDEPNHVLNLADQGQDTWVVGQALGQDGWILPKVAFTCLWSSPTFISSHLDQASVVS